MVCCLSLLHVSLQLRKVFILVLHLPINTSSFFRQKKTVLLRIDFEEDRVLGETPGVSVRLRSTETGRGRSGGDYNIALILTRTNFTIRWLLKVDCRRWFSGSRNKVNNLQTEPC